MTDVAAAAGVSLWTVSNTFSHPERVAPPTRERVLSAAAALGYRGPHPLARSLASGRTGLVALVGPHGAAPLLADPAASLVARGLLEACDRAGVSLVLSGAPGAAPVDGTVLLRYPGPAPAAGPVVTVDGPPTPAATAVAADLGSGTAEAARYLARLGHRALAVLTWPGAGARLEGARAGWGDAGRLEVLVAAEDDGLERGGTAPGQAAGIRAARTLLTRRDRPTAVLALTDAMALGVLETARWAGLEVPGDLSVVGVDDLPAGAAHGLTTVFVPYAPLGALAGTTLAALIAGGAAPAPAPLPTSLVIRGTAGPPVDRARPAG
ncbi:MAG TPA: LacI family DNA-binding transcriptional regulator [Miltoncostaeaceae bacterium]|nr:LacI family DNA-binding transcriptional regulator [Miltoncostaeaceae bacterium]